VYLQCIKEAALPNTCVHHIQSYWQFFVQVTKTKHAAHVILSTSDYSFLDWIKKGAGKQQSKLEKNVFAHARSLTTYKTPLSSVMFGLQLSNSLMRS
jgi:hypothetical protein